MPAIKDKLVTFSIATIVGAIGFTIYYVFIAAGEYGKATGNRWTANDAVILHMIKAVDDAGGDGVDELSKFKTVIEFRRVSEAD